MRRWRGVAALCAIALAAPAATAAERWRPDIRAAVDLVESRRGEIRFAVIDD